MEDELRKNILIDLWQKKNREYKDLLYPSYSCEIEEEIIKKIGENIKKEHSDNTVVMQLKINAYMNKLRERLLRCKENQNNAIDEQDKRQDDIDLAKIEIIVVEQLLGDETVKKLKQYEEEKILKGKNDKP